MIRKSHLERRFSYSTTGLSNGALTPSSAVIHRGKSPGSEESLESTSSSADDSSSLAMVRSRNHGDTTTEVKPIPSANTLASLSSVRRKVIFACLAANSILCMICLAIMIPFFPLVAAEKDPGGKDNVAGATAIGFIFTMSPLAEFLVAPFVGRLIPASGPKMILVLGGVLISGALVLFGFVHLIDQWGAFLFLCYALRAVQGVGTAFSITATLAVCVGIYPNNVSMIVGTVRAFNSLGFTIGPAMSGGLYDTGGFTLPFLVHAGLMFAGTIWIVFALPADGAAPEHTVSKKMTKDTLIIPWNHLWLWSCFLNGMAMGMLEPNVSPFLEEEFHLTPTKVGLVYLLYAGVLAITSPIIGIVADRWVNPKKFLAMSLLLDAIGFLLIGPWTETGLQPALWRTMLAMVVVALGSATNITITTPGVLHALHDAGYEDSLELHSYVGGIVTAFFAGGIAFGPTLGSTAVSAIGFEDATALFGAVMLFAGIVDVVVGLQQDCKCNGRHRGSYEVGERRPLLLSSSGKKEQSSQL